jgi:hypothetical protein
VKNDDTGKKTNNYKGGNYKATGIIRSQGGKNTQTGREVATRLKN